MFLDQPLAWTAAHWPVLAVAGVLALFTTALAAYIAHRTSGNVLAASIGALVCTGFSADTSWRFADHRLHMETSERLWLFAAGEIVLIVCAVMARANKIATATDTAAGTPGVPGVMVWCIAGVQVVPAFTESGVVGGLVRAVFGPVMAALLWHLAMGLEIRVAKPEALSTGLPAQIGHELRERLLSHLGLATRNRSAEEITRDRAHARAVRLASRRHLGPWGRARLAAAAARSHATTDGTRRHALLRDLAGRRTADELRTMDVASPWVDDTAPQPHAATPLGVTGAQLRRMDPVDAVRAVAAAHPDATPEELASLSTAHGVPVSATQVRIALRPAAALPQPDAQPLLTLQPQPVTSFDDAAAAALAIAQPTVPAPGTDASGAAQPQPSGALVLDLAPMLSVHPDVRAPEPTADTDAQPQPSQVAPAAAAPKPRAAASARSRSQVAQLRSPDADAQLLKRAQVLNTKSLAEDGKKAPLRLLQSELGIGQRRAQRIQAQLPDTLTGPAAQPPAKEA